MSRPVGRKQAGSYYTPESLSLPIARWVVESGARRILDPSAGPGSFLKALSSEGSRKGTKLSLHGIDVDPRILNGVWDLKAAGIPTTNLICSDFFATQPENTGWGYLDAVVGNPPYIRHHLASQEVLKRASSALAARGLTLPGQSDIWAYFVGYSTAFLRTGGNLVFVLPFAAIGADYSRGVLAYLEGNFASTRLLRLRERVFSGAREGTCVLACTGWGRGQSKVQYMDIDDVSDVHSALAEATRPDSTRPDSTTETESRWLPTVASSVLKDVQSHEAVSRLGFLADVHIGVVTGANKFFILPQAHEIIDQSQSILMLTRSRHLSGLMWTKEDEKGLVSSGIPCCLLRANGDPTEAMARYLTSEAATKIRDRHHCRSRQPWYSVRDVRPPDAFMPYMGAIPGRITPNLGTASCTNAIHRIFWREGNDSIATRAAVGSLTSVFALSQEVHGRAYGGGVLKIEPRGAKQCLLPLVEIEAVDERRLNRLLRTGNREEAQEVADHIVLGDGLGFTTNEQHDLRSLAERMAERRHVSPTDQTLMRNRHA